MSESTKPDSDAKEHAKSDDSVSDSGAETEGKASEATPPRRGAKRRIIDETLLDEDEARRLEARRAYNRQCAAKARKRSKDLIAQLQQQVEELSQDKSALERTNEVMSAQLQLLEQQNRTLMMNQRTQPPVSSILGAGAGALFGGLPTGFGAPAAAGSSGLPSTSLLESLSAQGRLASLQNEAQRGHLPQGLTRTTASAPSTNGRGVGGVGPHGRIDPNKFNYMG